MVRYLPLPNDIKVSKGATQTPVQFCHGDSDGVVKLRWAQAASEAVKAHGVQSVAFKVYRGLEHSASLAELEDVVKWLQARLPETPLPAKL
jgi:lysophospholipase II